LLLTPA